MTTFSRKKIRGFKRKLRQLDEWKKFIISYPDEYLTNNGVKIFRIHLSPFYWQLDINPHRKFHRHLYQAYFEILQKLKDNEVLKNNNLIVHLWLYYPRTVKSLIIVANKEDYFERNEIINAKETQKKLPQLFNNNFDFFNLKLGDDNVFLPIKNTSQNTDWQTLRLGDIWTIE